MKRMNEIEVLVHAFLTSVCKKKIQIRYQSYLGFLLFVYVQKFYF